MEDMRLLLVGNPNAGKSTLFNALTGGRAKVGNWHGVTVDVLERKAHLGGKRVTVCDLPGIYSLASMSMEEKVTRDYLASHDGTVVFVSECAGLERSLPLFLALLKKGKAGILVLTKRKSFLRQGGNIDEAALSERLGVPVISAEGKKGIKEKLSAVLPAQASDKAVRAEEVLAEVYTPVREGLSRLDGLLLSAPVCIPLFILLVLFTFFITFAPNLPGDLLKNAIEGLFTETLAGAAEGISSPVLKSFVINGLLGSLGGVLCFLPQICILFFALLILEESGFLSRLAYLTDGFFGKLGLNGRAVFSLLMGFGCTSAAILTTRGLDDKKIQRRVVACLPYVPCSAKLPVFLTLAASFSPNPFLAAAGLYALGILLSVGAAFLLRGKEKAPFVMELAPLQIPRPLFVLKSLLFQLKQFIIKVATIVLAFFMLSWLLSSFDFSFHLCSTEESMLATLCGGLRWVFAPIGMNDWKIAYAALSGLIAKENVAGALSMFYGGFPYSAASGFAFATFMLACSPCVSAIAATSRELGAKRAIAYAALQTVSALLLSYLVYFALLGGVVTVIVVPV
ncbi:MAG: ferrous iron transporter B, partial [Clostridia bacterium]|nr:ferrous iron transporter B [Clostridia bacterium]